MIKELTTKTTYSLQFTEEERKKVNDFLFELTGLTDISKTIIEPYGMYIEITEVKKEPQIAKATFNGEECEYILFRSFTEAQEYAKQLR